MALVSKTAVLTGVKGKVEVKEYEVPKAKGKELVIKTEVAAICGTDSHIYFGHLDFVPFPIVLGHEFCGTIVDMGEDVDKDILGNPVRLGDRIVIAPGIPCGQCYNCKIAKNPTRCGEGECYGFMPNEEPHLLTGGFSQYVHIKYPNTAYFKTDLPAEIACLTEPMSIVLHGFERVGAPIGGTVVVQGTGAVGLGAIAFAKRCGAVKVIAVGGPKGRLDMAKELGADVVIDIAVTTDSKERTRTVLAETPGGRGADMVIEAVGRPVAIPEGFSMLRDSGKFLELGHFTDAGTVEINPHWDIVRKDALIVGPWGSAANHLKDSLALLENRDFPYEKLVSHKIKLDEIEMALKALKNTEQIEGRDPIKVAVDPWK